MYGESETDLSRRHLHMIFEDVKETAPPPPPTVFLNVNENFRRTTECSLIANVYKT